MSSSPKQEDSSKTIRLLVILVAALSFLLVLVVGAVIAIALLLFQSNGEEVAQRQASPETKNIKEDMLDPAGVKMPEVAVGVVKKENHGTIVQPLAPLPDEFSPADRPTESDLRYLFSSNDPVLYEYSSSVSIKDAVVSRNGRVTYRFRDENPVEFLRDVYDEMNRNGDEEEPFSLSASGTGFVVHPDGLIVTCAHVVNDSKNVDVKLGGKTWRGTVVKTDEKHDLALVRVEPDEPLRYLAIANSTPSLGTSARVFGFPMTDQLGRTLKLTTGTVSGFDNVGDKTTRLQLDATANPGNSGGPVTNDDGAVLGVVDSILAGGQVADMSFAVPGNQLQKFLDESAISFRLADENENDSQSIRELGEVSQAVAMIEISGDDLANNWKIADVTVTSRRGTQRSNAFVLLNGRVPSPFGKSETLRGKIVVDSRGKIIYASGSSLLPVVMQNAMTIGISELPQAGDKKWTAKESLLLRSETTEREDDSIADPFGFRGFGGRSMRMPFAPMHPFGRSRATKEITRQTLEAVEVVDDFEVSASEPQVKIRQRRKVRKHDLSDKKDSESVVLRGETIFRPEVGLLDSGKLKGDLETKVDGKSFEAEVAFSFKRISKEMIEAEKQKKKDQLAKRKRVEEANEKSRQAAFKRLDGLSDGEPGFSVPLGLRAAGGEDVEKATVENPRVVAKIPKGRGQGTVAISADGDFVAVGLSRSLQLYRLNDDGDDYVLADEYKGDGPVFHSLDSIEFSVNGNRLVGADVFGKTQIFDIEDGQLKKLLSIRRGKPLAIDQDGRLVALYLTNGNELSVFDIDSEETVLEVSEDLYPSRVSDVCFSSDGGQLIVAQGSRASLIDIESGEVSDTMELPFKGSRTQAVFGGNGRFILGGRKAVSVATGETIELPAHEKCYAISGDGNWFVYLRSNFDETIQFDRIGDSERYRIDPGDNSGHWNAFGFAAKRNRMVAFEVFSESIFVIDFP